MSGVLKLRIASGERLSIVFETHKFLCAFVKSNSLLVRRDLLWVILCEFEFK